MTSPTADRIAAAALRRFNRTGYAATKLQQIADDVGISQGNLTYHFPTKLDLALHLSETVRATTADRLAQRVNGDIADDYVGHLLFGMELTWTYRFLLRDPGIFNDVDDVVPPSPILIADFEALFELISRVADEGLLRADMSVDLHVFTRSLWILSRHWMDYLREMEQRDHIDWTDVARGVEHHFVVLLPMMTVAGRQRFTRALDRASPPSQADAHTRRNR
ncbi:MAG: TetR/AcrR family transcriptional regulator [Actinomycetota bacterium]